LHIPEDEQLYSDFDWFCVDNEGFIGHFTTAGFKRLPKSVAACREDLDSLMRYFKSAAPLREGHIVDSDLATHVPDVMSRGERHLHSFVAMADKGLYSYDIESYLRENSVYFRVALPIRPLHVSELPSEISKILCGTILETVRFREAAEIGYAATLNA